MPDIVFLTLFLGLVIAVQRIAWIAADPLVALHAHPTADCGFEPIATTRQ